MNAVISIETLNMPIATEVGNVLIFILFFRVNKTWHLPYSI